MSRIKTIETKDIAKTVKNGFSNILSFNCLNSAH